MKLNKFYKRIRYWRQLRKGYGLLSDLNAPRQFEIVDGKAFIMNGVDPLVRVDLVKSIATQYKPPSNTRFGIYYKIKAK